MIFAQIMPQGVDAAVIGNLVLGLIQLLTLLKLVQRKPSIEAEFATKVEVKADIKEVADDLAAHVAENKKDHEGIFTKIGGHERGVNESLTQLAVAQGGTSKAVEIMGNRLMELASDIKTLARESRENA